MVTLSLALILLAGPPAPVPEPIHPWPRGEVVYRFDASVPASDRRAFAEAAALWTWEGSPVRFPEVPDDGFRALAWGLGLDRSLLVREDPRLAAFGATTLGAGTRRELVFNPARSSDGWLAADLAHELGHVLGLTHEHQRRDRDRYVAFPPGFLDHLPADRRGDYALDPADPAPGDDRPYDYGSLMHYSSNVDGNGMVRRDTGALVPGAHKPSEGDRRRVGRLYSSS
jgi:hypothetical protein